MAKLNISVYDQTLYEIDRMREKEKSKEKPRLYLGMSQIGEDCQRKLYYSFRIAKQKPMEAQGIRATEDGFLQEDIMARFLSNVPGIELYTRDPENPTKQIEFLLLLDHFRGHADGIIKGILESPKTWHIWEHKSVNLKKLGNLIKLRAEKGEKEALYHWDIIYYAQAQIYMHCSQLNRHYLTVTSPGGRDYISVRTEYNRKYAESIIEKAKNIIFGNTIPAKLGERRESYACKFCAYIPVCHDHEFPDKNCKTCSQWEPVKDAGNFCNLYQKLLSFDEILTGCDNHVFNSVLITRICQPVNTKKIESKKAWDSRLK